MVSAKSVKVRQVGDATTDSKAPARDWMDGVLPSRKALTAPSADHKWRRGSKFSVNTFFSDRTAKGSGVSERISISRWLRVIFGGKDESDEKYDAKPVSFLQLFRFASMRERHMVAIGAAFALLVGAIQPFSMYLNGRIADILINYGNYTAIRNESQFLTDGFVYVFISCGIGFGLVAFSFAQYYFLRAAAIDIINTLRVKFILSILRQDAAFFGTRKFGAINAQLNSNIERVGDGIGDKIGLLLRGVASFVAAMAVAFFVNWRIALSMSPVGPVCLIIMSSLSKVVSYAARRSQRATEAAGAVLQETLLNVRTVQACNGERTMVKKFARRLNAGRRDAVLQYIANGMFDGFFFFSLYIFNAIGAYYGAGRVLYGEATGGDVIIVTNLIIVGSYYLGAMSPYIANIFKARVAAAVIYAQIDMIPERIDSYSSEGKSLVSSSGCNIEFDNVAFAYPLGDGKRREVLRRVSWQAQPGESVALVGHSGCGKSTCISLIARLYECDSGAVRVNGIDVKELNIQSLRRAIGIVAQEPVLFGGSIFENIALGDSAIAIDQVKAACRIANAHNFIEKLEHGYQTRIGAGSVKLSGGQKQRIAIARALINDPPILLLDEATSALDAESEILVQQALENASRNRTTVIIAHRLSTLRNADKIVVIDQGRVVEIGTHKSLNDNIEGVYAKLVQSQSFANLSNSVISLIGTGIAKEDDDDEKSESKSFNTETKVSEESDLAHDKSQNHTKKLSTISEDAESIISVKKETKSLWETSIIRVYRNADRNYKKLTTAIVFSAIRGIELVLYVQLVGAIFISYADYNMDDKVDSFYNRQYVIVAGNIALGMFCLITISIGQSFCGWTTENVVDSLKIRAFRNILRQDGAFFDKARCSGPELIKRITADAYALKAPLDFRLFKFVNNSSAIVTLMVVSLTRSWRITLIGFIILIIMSIAPTCISLRMQRRVAKKQREDEISKIAVEVIENVRTIQLLSKEQYFYQKYRDHLLLMRRPDIVTAIFDGIIFALVQSFIFISDAFCFGAGLLAVYYQLNTPNDVYIASMNIGTANYAILFISTSLRDILRAKTQTDSIFDLIDAKPIISEGTLTTVERGDVDVDSVDFAYPTRPRHLVADNLTLNVRKGECVALVGPSGGGKSTVISLLQRFYDPKSGSIQIDGVNISQYSLRSLREQIAMVEQEPVLFSGSIYDNVRLGVESNTTLEDVVKACEMANAKSFIESLPLGYQTEVGEKSSKLSGGQKQRIAIARALIRQPKILLLDEATSALDAHSEEAVRQALYTAQCQRACITIAHRLSSIQNADRVYFIRNGHVVESGTYRELLADSRSQFAQMVAKQQSH